MARANVRVQSNPYSLEKMLGLALFVSLALHILASWIFFFVIPAYQSARSVMSDDIMVVSLTSLIPEAGAAPPMPVDENLQGPDVRPVFTPPTPAPQPVADRPEPVTPATKPADLIPIAEKTEKEPEITKTDTPKHEVTPPPVREEPKPNPKPRPSLDTRINNVMEDLEQKRKLEAAANLDNEILNRVGNIAIAQGRGQGEGSEMSGSNTNGVQFDPEKARYYSLIQDKVSQNWVAPASAMSADLVATYQIKIEPDGRVSASRLHSSSGNSDYDLSVERAVKQSLPFPPLPAVFGGQADNPRLRFHMRDLLRGSAAY